MIIYIFFKEKKRDSLAYGSILKVDHNPLTFTVTFTDSGEKTKEFSTHEIESIELEFDS